MRRLAAIAVLIACASVLAGCSTGAQGAASGADTTPAAPLTSAEKQQLSSEVVDAAQFPALTPHTQWLSFQDLVGDADLPNQQAELAAMGYRGGVERQLQGRGTAVSQVQNRVLLFDSTTGAAAFVRHVHENVWAYFGSVTASHPLRVGPWRGWRFRPPSCACPDAQPLQAAVLSRGRVVQWWQIGGPRVQLPRLQQVLSTYLRGRRKN